MYGRRPPEREQVAWVALNLVEGLGPLRLERLLAHCGGPVQALEAPDEIWHRAGVPAEARCAPFRRRLRRRAEREMARVKRRGWSLLVRADPSYPAALLEIPDPPTVLYARGRPGPPDQVAVAVVGSRRATPYGLRAAEGLGVSLARAGITVVSGLARGIDSAAHRGALEAGGRTLAVLGSGLDDIYPPEHGDLAAEIAASGAVLSEFPLRTPPHAGHFPRRNRVVSGLCRAVVVVEGAAGSGSLITARLALDQGREVGAVPGPIHSETSTGPHCLIREGAFLVQRAEDVLEALPAMARQALQPREDTERPPAGSEDRPGDLSAAEQAVLSLLDGTEAHSLDSLLARCERPAGAVLEALFTLEMRGVVTVLPGRLYLRRI